VEGFEPWRNESETSLFAPVTLRRLLQTSGPNGGIWSYLRSVASVRQEFSFRMLGTPLSGMRSNREETCYLLAADFP